MESGKCDTIARPSKIRRNSMMVGALRAFERDRFCLYEHFPLSEVQITALCWLNAAPIVFIWLRNTKAVGYCRHCVFMWNIAHIYMRSLAEFARMQTSTRERVARGLPESSLPCPSSTFLHCSSLGKYRVFWEKMVLLRKVGEKK